MLIILGSAAGCSTPSRPAPAEPDPAASLAFADSNLAQAVSLLLAEDGTDPADLTELRLGGRGIRLLNGIESLTSLHTLDLSDNAVEDVSPLAALDSLVLLNLASNRIRDLGPLGGLQQLNILLLESNRIEDIAPLVALPALEVVRLQGNPLDATQIERLVQLESQGVRVESGDLRAAPDEPVPYPGPIADCGEQIAAVAAHTTVSTPEELDALPPMIDACFRMQGGLSVSGPLLDLHGLRGLVEVAGGLVLTQNEALTDLRGLDNLVWVGQFLRLVDNTGLVSLVGLENLARVTGQFEIASNHGLESLRGLEGLRTVEGFVIIRDNANLRSLAGLDNLQSVGAGGLHILNNPRLPTATAEELAARLRTAGFSGTIQIRNNGP